MIKAIRQTLLVMLDIIFIYAAYIIAFFIRFDGEFFTSEIVADYLTALHNIILPLVAIKLVVLYVFGMYTSLWRHASIDELVNVVKGVVFATAVSMSFVIIRGLAFPRSIYIITFMLDIIFIGGVRFSYRWLRMVKNKQKRRITTCRNVMIIGAGQAGAMIIKEMLDHPQLNMNPVAVIDDDSIKQKKQLHGVPIVGGRDDIEWSVLKYKVEEIIIAIPSVPKSDVKQFIDICNKTNAKLEILPGMYELMDGKVSINQIREVDIRDILGREEVALEIDSINEYIEDKVVLVTGAGGSIGSELCRQIVSFNPKQLVMLDIYENSVYSVELELKRKYPEKNIEVLIGSVRDRERVFEIFNQYKPNAVFHAAAHKHVPLMEASPKEAIKNNVFGTKNLIDAAKKYEADRFTLISTDKAVNPTNIMGASKRICEMLVQAQHKNEKTKFVAVRFGNVLGSNGSVIPIFKKQIEEGGPVTLTHPDIIRYFMTIPEASKLVIQAASLAVNGEIFVLDMGEPMKISDLAENMIRLSGFEPHVEIPIEIVGLRPGEKLYEELILDHDNCLSTKYDKIFIEKPVNIEETQLSSSLDRLRFTIEKGKVAQLRSLVEEIVPTYKPKLSEEKAR